MAGRFGGRGRGRGRGNIPLIRDDENKAMDVSKVDEAPPLYPVRLLSWSKTPLVHRLAAYASCCVQGAHPKLGRLLYTFSYCSACSTAQCAPSRLPWGA